jgi:hypothetical protein
MTTEQSAEVQAMPLWKAVLVAFAVLAVIIAWIMLGKFGLKLHNPWVGLVALTTFGAAYHNNLPDAPKIWIGSAVALLLGYLLWYLPTIMGPVAGGITGLVLITLLLGGFIAQKLPLICNFGTFMMLTVSTAAEQIMNAHEHLLYFQDLAYAAVCFWIIPLCIVKLKAMKENK